MSKHDFQTGFQKKEEMVTEEKGSVEIVSVDEMDKIKDSQMVKAVVSNTTSVNLRSTPEKKSDNVVAILTEGTEVEIIGESKIYPEWIQVYVSGSDLKGFIMEKYIFPKEG